MDQANSPVDWGRVFQVSPVPMTVIDRHRAIVSVNRALIDLVKERLGGEIRGEDRVGKDILAFIDPANDPLGVEGWRGVCADLLERGIPYRNEAYAFISSEGLEVVIDLEAVPLYDEEGGVVGAIVARRDVTDQAIAQRAEKRRVALDRLRVSVYEMKDAGDIQGVLAMFCEVLRDVGVAFEDCSVQIVDEARGCVESHYLASLQPPLRMELPLADSVGYEVWRNQEPIYRRDLDEEDRYGQRMMIRELSGKPIRSVLGIPFSHGTIATNSVQPSAFSQADIDVLEQFASVLSEAYVRVEDMRRAEATEILRRQAALDRVRVSMYEMRDTADAQDVLLSLHSALKSVGLVFDNLSLQIVHEEEETFDAYAVDPEQVELTISRGPLRKSAVHEAFRSRQPVYRPDLAREDRYHDRENIRRTDVRSVLDVPFSCGTIGINSVRPSAFSGKDVEVLRQFSQVMSEAYVRVEDMRRIEESEREYRSLVTHSQDVIFRLDLEGNYLLISPVVERLTGYAPEEFYTDRTLGRRIALSEDLEKAEEGFRKALDGATSRNLEYRIRGRDGTIRWVSQNTFPIRDSRERIVVLEGVIRDITEHKQDEEKLLLYQEQLRSLASQLSLAEEQERRRIAMDLHDHIGQMLSFAHMRLAAVREQISSPELVGPLEEIRALNRQMMRDTRSLTFELSPPVLYELGLAPALERLAEQFQEQHGIVFEVRPERWSEPLADDVRVFLFRVVREALINIVKHAHARQARVSLRREGHHIRVEIEDDGVGFDASDVMHHGLGLFSMRERLKYLGGRCEIVSEVGCGTRVTLLVPLRNGQREDAP